MGVSARVGVDAPAIIDTDICICFWDDGEAGEVI